MCGFSRQDKLSDCSSQLAELAALLFSQAGGLTFSGTSKLTSVDMGSSPSRTTGADSLLLASASPGRRSTLTQGEEAGSSASLLPALNTVRPA
jgi:hypothetical protein